MEMDLSFKAIGSRWMQFAAHTLRKEVSGMKLWEKNDKKLIAIDKGLLAKACCRANTHALFYTWVGSNS